MLGFCYSCLFFESCIWVVFLQNIFNVLRLDIIFYQWYFEEETGSFSALYLYSWCLLEAMIRCYFTLGLNATPELIIKYKPFQVLSLTLYLTYNTYTTAPYIKFIILWAGSSRFEIKVRKRIWKTGTTSPSLEKQGLSSLGLNAQSYTEMRFCISGSPISPQAETKFSATRWQHPPPQSGIYQRLPPESGRWENEVACL